MRRALIATLALLLALGGLAAGIPLVLAQGLPPYSVVYSGSVTVAGEPAPDGLEITVRMGTIEGRPQKTKGGAYNSLSIAGDSSMTGRTITFWLNGQVMAAETDVFPSGGPVTRTINLTFPSLPPPPTPTPTPTSGEQPTPTPLPPVQAALGLADPQRTAVRRGEELALLVTVDSRGAPIGQGQARISFDPRVLQPVDAATGPVLGDVPSLWKDEGSAVSFIFAGAAGSGNAGGLLRVVFQVRPDAPDEEAQVVLEELSLGDRTGNSFTVETDPTTMVVQLRGIPGDLNRDGVVDLLDLVALGASYNVRSGDAGFLAAADLNGDGQVDMADLAILVGNFGRKES